MGELTLYKDNDEGNTVISNCFIDHYLADANDAQIKVYLYLLRMMSANKATSVSDLADKFNHTEKDVCRALRYWEQKGLLSLDYDSNGNLKGIRMLSPHSTAVSDSFTPFVTLMPVGIKSSSTPEVTSKDESSSSESSSSYIKKNYSLDELKSFKNRDDTSQILFIAEQYLKKTLSANDIRSILFITDTLHFSQDLIDYLLQYCVQRGKKDFRYIEKVAISWAEEHITTPKEAQEYAGRYEKNVYTIMNALGKTAAPTPREIDYIHRWNNDFSQDMILEACERTVLATDKHRFEYADKILDNWKNAGVRHKEDLAAADSNYRKMKSSPKKSQTNMFHQFTQNDYDFDALEQKLLSRK